MRKRLIKGDFENKTEYQTIELIKQVNIKIMDLKKDLHIVDLENVLWKTV